jgi:hypothetical protein
MAAAPGSRVTAAAPAQALRSSIRWASDVDSRAGWVEADHADQALGLAAWLKESLPPKQNPTMNTAMPAPLGRAQVGHGGRHVETDVGIGRLLEVRPMVEVAAAAPDPCRPAVVVEGSGPGEETYVDHPTGWNGVGETLGA